MNKNSIFTRFRQTRLAPENKIVTLEEIKADPITPLPEPIIQRIQICAYCGEHEATHPVKVGWFYLGRLPHVGICDSCYEVAKQKEAVHHLSQKKTVVEHAAIPSRPRARAKRVVLEERSVNLALEG